MGFIYVVTSPVGKSYVGQTVNHPSRRLREHCEKNRRNACTALKHALDRYGGAWDPVARTISNFRVRWYECRDDKLDEQETRMIKHLGTLSPNGYNLTPGGGRPPSRPTTTTRRPRPTTTTRRP